MSSIPKSGTHFMTEFYYKIKLKRHRIQDKKYISLIHELHDLGEGKTDYNNPQLKALRDPIIEAILKMPKNHFVYNHYPYDPILLQSLVDANIPIVFLIRDPRDYVVSFTNHILRRSDHKHHRRFYYIKSDEERFLTVIMGAEENEEFQGVLPMKFMYEKMFGWLKNEQVLTLRFEEVIGVKGGGSKEVQYRTFEKLMKHINCPLEGDELYRLIDSSYNENANLFVKGKIGQWREDFSEKVLECFNEQAGYLLKILGYSETERFLSQISLCSENYDKNHLKQTAIAQLQERIVRLEKESEARLAEIRKRDETILKLREELKSLKTEINSYIGNKIIRKIQTIWENKS